MRYMCLAIILLSSVLLNGSFAGWERTYGGVYDEHVFSLVIDEGKNYVLSGQVWEDYVIGNRFYLIKVDNAGDLMWEKTYRDGWAECVSLGHDDSYIVGGYVSDGFHSYYGIVKTDIDGDSIWIKSYRSGPGYVVSSISVIGNDGYLLLCEADPSEHEIYFIRIDNSGDSLWTRTFGREGNERGFSLTKTHDNDFIAVGFTSISGLELDLYAIKIDSLGDMLWDTTYGSSGTNVAYFIDTTSDGNYIITGKTSLYYSVLFDVYLLKINDDGDTLWTRKIGGEDESDIGRCVRPTSDGGYIIVGYTYSYGIGTPDYSNVYLIKTDSEGYVEWERTYGGPGEDKGYSVSQTDDGGYIIAGVYDQGPHTDVYLIKTDSLGNVDWIREPGGKPQEISLHISPNPFNSVCRIDASFDAAVEIYDLAGHQLATGTTPYVWQPDESISSGIYLIRATTKESLTETKRVFYLK